MNSKSLHTMRVSRRRALAVSLASVLAAGGAALPRPSLTWRVAAQGTPIASPSAGEPPEIAAPPLPSTLAADASPEFRAVAEALVAAMGEHQVPGAAIGLLAGDREEHATFGVASLSSLRPVTPQTLFQIGSLTKTYTATAVWRLIDEGALALDTPVRDVIPGFTLADETAAAEVTVANLLDHSAGFFGDEGFDTGDDDSAIARYVTERMPHLPQIFPPGAFFSYNNAGFTLLGRLIEVTTGTAYDAAMAHLLFGPLGLGETLLDRVAVLARPFADGHVALPINGHPAIAVQTPLWIPRSVDPAGGIWATTRDVIRYARFHLATGTVGGAANVVSPESLLRMREPALPVPGFPVRMGRNWFVQDVAGARVFYHAGDTHGQHTELYACPEPRFALIVLTNGQGGGGAAAAAVLDTVLDQFPALAPLSGKIGSTGLRVPASAPSVTLPADTIAAYAGRYEDPSQAITIAPRGEGLTLTIEQNFEPGAYRPAILPPPAPPLPAAFLAEDLAAVNGTPLPFVRDAEDRVGWVGLGLRLVPRAGADAN